MSSNTRTHPSGKHASHGSSAHTHTSAYDPEQTRRAPSRDAPAAHIHRVRGHMLMARTALDGIGMSRMPHEHEVHAHASCAAGLRTITAGGRRRSRRKPLQAAQHESTARGHRRHAHDGAACAHYLPLLVRSGLEPSPGANAAPGTRRTGTTVRAQWRSNTFVRMRAMCG